MRSLRRKYAAISFHESRRSEAGLSAADAGGRAGSEGRLGSVGILAGEHPNTKLEALQSSGVMRSFAANPRVTATVRCSTRVLILGFRRQAADGWTSGARRPGGMHEIHIARDRAVNVGG